MSDRRCVVRESAISKPKNYASKRSKRKGDRKKWTRIYKKRNGEHRLLDGDNNASCGFNKRFGGGNETKQE